MRRVMPRSLLILVALVAPLVAQRDDEKEGASEAVTSRIEKTAAGELILVHEAWIDAPVSEVWKAHTTAEGWTRWASTQARIDLRIGGKIETRYDSDGKLGEPGTNTLHIVNYVPETLLTLRAEIAPNWPEVLKADADKLTSVTLFDAVGEKRTRLRSYGLGYSDKPEVMQLLTFFRSANEGLLRKLKAVLEQ